MRERKLKKSIIILVAVVFFVLLFSYLVIGSNFIFDKIVPQANKDILLKANKIGGCLALTFDDGYKSDYDIAFPLLEKYGFNATFFILPNHYDSKSPNLMNRSDIKKLSENGHEIGSHSITHSRLFLLSEEKAFNEISESKRIIEKDFNISVKSFAFPYVTEIHKNTIEYANENYKNIRAYNYALNKRSDIKNICNKIDEAKKNNKVIVLMIHKLTKKEPAFWDTNQEEFKELLSCSKDSGIKVDTLDNCLN